MSGGMSGSPGRRIGLDVGGTNVLGIAISSDGRIVAEDRRPTPRGDNSLGTLLDVLVELSGSLGYEGSLGVGVPGLVTRQGVLRAAPHIDGVADFEIGRILAERLGGHVEIENDATCAVIAEWKLGAAIGVSDMVLITLGTGIGGGMIANGSVLRGANGFAGEIGHMVVDPDGPQCSCGRQGCWERYASGSGLAMLARNAGFGVNSDGKVSVGGADQSALRGEHIQSAARQGDSAALAVIDEFCRWVALGLSNLTNVFDPEVFVLGGGLADGADLYLEPISRWFEKLLYQPHLRTLPRVKFAQWGPQAGALGAALLPGMYTAEHPSAGI